MEQHPAALDMAEEAVAEPRALVRPRDQARDVGEDEFAPGDAHDAEPGMERREGIVGDLRLRRRDGGEEGRLARVGQADEARIGDELQAQPDPALLALLAGIGPPGGAVRRGGEMGVAEAAVAALGQEHPLADLGHVGDERLAVLGEDLGADRDLEHHVLAAGAGAVRAHAVLAALGL